MTSNNFIDDLKEKCKEANVKLVFGKGKYIKYFGTNIKVSGYFADNPATLVCSMNNSHCMQTLVHESCHMDQWSEKMKLWVHSSNCGDDDIFDKWLLGKDFPEYKMIRIINRIQQIELDCERRSVEKIKQYNLKINIEEYIKNANSYIYLYTYIKEKRKWPDKAPYKIKKIMDLMPSRFLKDYSKLKPEVRKVFELCYKK